MAYYYGCWSKQNTGHFLFDEQGQSFASYTKVSNLPQELQPKYLDTPPQTPPK